MGEMFPTCICVTFLYLLAFNANCLKLKRTSWSEGRKVALQFRTNYTEYSNCSVTIAFNGVVFADHSEGIISISLLKEKYERYTFDTITICATCLRVIMNIAQAHPSDAGNYTFINKCGNNTFVQDLVYIVTVFYPPKITYCNWYSNLNFCKLKVDSDDHACLICAFRPGLPPGNVVCYEAVNISGKNYVAVLPLVGRPYSGGTNNDTFFIHKEADISCCAVSAKFTIKPDKCNEFQRRKNRTSRLTTPTNIISNEGTKSSPLTGTEAIYTPKATVQQPECTSSQALLIAFIIISCLSLSINIVVLIYLYKLNI